MPLSKRSPLRSGHLLQREWPSCTVHPALAASALQQHFYVNHMNIVSIKISQRAKSKKKQNHCAFVLYIELKRTRCSGSLQLKFIYFFYIFTTVATKGNPLHWCPITAGACGKNSRESNSFSGQSCECDSKYTTASYLLIEAMEPFHDEGLLCNHLCELWHLESFRYISLAGPRALACHTFQSAMSSMKVIESSESQLHFTTCNGANKHHKRKHTVWWNSA